MDLPCKNGVTIKNVSFGNKIDNHEILAFNPKLNTGSFVFITSKEPVILNIESLLVFKEPEGFTHIIETSSNQTKYEQLVQWAWITLQYQSGLQEIGITAKFSTALANEKIACNVVAGFYHDHIFVPYSDRQAALNIIENL